MQSQDYRRISLTESSVTFSYLNCTLHPLTINLFLSIIISPTHEDISTLLPKIRFRVQFCGFSRGQPRTLFWICCRLQRWLKNTFRFSLLALDVKVRNTELAMICGVGSILRPSISSLITVRVNHKLPYRLLKHFKKNKYRKASLNYIDSPKLNYKFIAKNDNVANSSLSSFNVTIFQDFSSGGTTCFIPPTEFFQTNTIDLGADLHRQSRPI